ncbi:MAG: heme exporter protein CcmB [Pseudomonadota bacterium]
MIALLRRDLMLAVRSGGGFGLALVFFLIVVTLTPLALGADTTLLAQAGPGVLWLGALLSCLLSVDRIFGPDHEDGSLEVLATAPIPAEAVFVIKAAAQWITTGLPLALIAPVLAVLLHIDAVTTWTVALGLLIGTPALSLIGAFGGALTLGIKRGGLLLSLLVLPLYVPTLIFGAEAARRAAQTLPTDTPLLLLGGISLFTAAIFPFAGAAVLRINLR